MTALVCRGCRRSWGFSNPEDATDCAWCGGELVEVPEEPAPEPVAAWPVAVDARRAAQLLGDWVAETPSAGPELAATAGGLRLVWLPGWRVSARARGRADVTVEVDERGPGSFVEVWAAGRWSRGAAPAPARRLRGTARVDEVVEGLWIEALAQAPLPPPAGAPSPTAPPGPVLLPSRGPADGAACLEDAVRGHVVEAAVARFSASRAVEGWWRPDPPTLPTRHEDRWELVARPAYLGWYRDHEGVVRTLVVDGVTGACAGPRVGSPAVAAALAGRLTATALAVTAFAAFLTLVGLVVWLLLPVAGALGLVARSLVVSARSAGPAVAGWNRRAVPDSGASVPILSAARGTPVR